MGFEQRLGFSLFVIGIALILMSTEQRSRADLPKCNECTCIESVVFMIQDKGTCEGTRERVDGKTGDPIDHARAAWAPMCMAGAPQVVVPNVQVGEYNYGQNCTANCQGEVGLGHWITATINPEPTFAYANSMVFRRKCPNPL
jgi:hypothetical protein